VRQSRDVIPPIPRNVPNVSPTTRGSTYPGTLKDFSPDRLTCYKPHVSTPTIGELITDIPRGNTPRTSGVRPLLAPAWLELCGDPERAAHLRAHAAAVSRRLPS